jgi:CBS domain-containing protein
MDEQLEPPVVRDFMITEVFTVSPDMTLDEVVNLLVEKRIPCAPVVIKKANFMELIGIISEKDCIDYLSNEIFYGNPDALVKHMMEKVPLCVSPDTDIFSIAIVFRQHDYRYLPVVENKQLEGVVCRRDALNSLLNFHKKVVKEKAEGKSPLDYHEIANLRFVIR